MALVESVLAQAMDQAQAVVVPALAALVELA